MSPTTGPVRFRFPSLWTMPLTPLAQLPWMLSTSSFAFFNSWAVPNPPSGNSLGTRQNLSEKSGRFFYDIYGVKTDINGHLITNDKIEVVFTKMYRNVMNGKQKIYFLLDAIDDARVLAPIGQPLIIDPTNDLNCKYRDIELEQIFTKLEKDLRVLNVVQTPS